MSLEAKERQQEEEQLRNVLRMIDEEIEEAAQIAGGRKEQLVTGKKELWEEVVYDTDDWFEAAAQLTQQAQELSQQATSYRLAKGRAERLELVKSSPYFGRLDFRESGEEELLRIYIGTMSLIDDDTNEVVVYDWRTPVASMYYDYGPGPAEYEAPAATIKGEITLKRQYVIRGGKLLSVFDTGVTIGDDMLKQMLGRNTEPRMKSIVTTIQREQNQIIRNTQHRYLFVQGAAGSGKTSAALQRIAYLLYRHRNNWSPEQVVLFSPNDVFNDYVSGVLPELGEEPIPQTTFFDYVWSRLRGIRPPEHPYDQLEFVYSPEKHDDYAQRMAGIRLKASKHFADVLDRYAASLDTDGVRFLSIKRKEKTLIGAERLTRMFYEEYANKRIPIRLASMQEKLLEELGELEKKSAVTLYRKMLKAPQYLGTEDELKRLSLRKARKAYEPVREDVKQFRFVDIAGTYLQLFEREGTYEKLCAELKLTPSADWPDAAADTPRRLDGEKLPYEDAVPLLYLLEAFHGASRRNRIRHVVVDEAQDYSPLQWSYLRRLFPNAGFTALGDINQAIQGSGVERGHLESETLFPAEETATIRLLRSYRSTKEIVDFTRGMIPGGGEIEPFERSGEAPAWERTESAEVTAQRTAELIEALRQEGMSSIAVITKTAAECDEAMQALPSQLKIKRLTKDSQSFESGVVALPSYLAKGLEFDAVIVWNAGEHRYGREEERKLFYTVCTRALHRLHLFYNGRLTPFVVTESP
ncbi:RNA polymerase recycling motor HelD [Paenibacillus thermotolerans]|uniref:RNA polymerase recycling motor HelD n=1 Tax=Paenibacillus thermotolerans TaxID=3027807 RepID=UPI0023675900|nr:MULTISPECIES: RNA polymerase recycling motor HelD [unclassified Paenibacillus]